MQHVFCYDNIVEERTNDSFSSRDVRTISMVDTSEYTLWS